MANGKSFFFISIVCLLSVYFFLIQYYDNDGRYVFIHKEKQPLHVDKDASNSRSKSTTSTLTSTSTSTSSSLVKISSERKKGSIMELDARLKNRLMKRISFKNYIENIFKAQVLPKKRSLLGNVLVKKNRTTTSTKSPVNTNNYTVSNISVRLGLVSKYYVGGHDSLSKNICKNKNKNVTLLILVTSAVSHSSQRMAIRYTWGHFAIRKDIALAFFTGKSDDKKLTSKIESEQELYEDIIMGNFYDSYLNLTLKTVSMLEWITLYCPNAIFVLKTDDDMFINLHLLLKNLFKLDPNAKAFYGKLGTKFKPFRNVESKYYVNTDEYSKDVYPEITTGPAYMFPRFLAPELFDASLKHRFFKLEDVFLTGMVANDLNVTRRAYPGFQNVPITLTSRNIKTNIGIHQMNPKKLYDAWKKLLDSI